MKERGSKSELSPSAKSIRFLLGVIQTHLKEDKHPFKENFGQMLQALSLHFLGEGVFVEPSYRIMGREDVHHPSDLEDLLQGRNLKQSYLVVSNRYFWRKQRVVSNSYDRPSEQLRIMNFWLVHEKSRLSHDRARWELLTLMTTGQADLLEALASSFGGAGEVYRDRAVQSLRATTDRLESFPVAGVEVAYEQVVFDPRTPTKMIAKPLSTLSVVDMVGGRTELKVGGHRDDDGQFVMRDIHKTFEAMPAHVLMPLVHLGGELEKVSQKVWRQSKN